MLFRLLAVAVCLLSTASARHRVDSANTYFRLVCVVPMVGSGSPADPKRPQYAPLPPKAGARPGRSGILAAGYLASDDGKYALVEFVAADRAAFAPI